MSEIFSHCCQDTNFSNAYEKEIHLLHHLIEKYKKENEILRHDISTLLTIRDRVVGKLVSQRAFKIMDSIINPIKEKYSGFGGLL